MWSTPLDISLMLGIYALSNGAWGLHPVYVEPTSSFDERRMSERILLSSARRHCGEKARGTRQWRGGGERIAPAARR